ncbi:MAG: hypothetical protein IKO17_02285, partial [Prevotella sp.]|nr:hypothetical protein [Prevotella sp.]
MLLSLFAMSAMAADLITRTAPEAPSALVNVDEVERTPAEFVAGNYYVLFNKGAQQFFTEGNSWGTQASLGDGASLARFTLPDGKTPEDATLIFNNFSPSRNSWKQVFFDSSTTLWVDRSRQEDYFWQVVPVEGEENTYRLQASPSNPTLNPANNPGFVGVAEYADGGIALSPFLEEGWIDWEFYSIPEWCIYGPLKDAYDASVTLKTAIEKAEAAGIDVAAAVAVYNNEESTAVQINEAVATLMQAMESNIANATGQFPQDASAWITNGTFNTIGDFTGWSTNNGKFGAGGTTSTNAEVYGKNAFDINQDITILYPGLYLFGVKGFYRAGS